MMGVKAGQDRLLYNFSLEERVPEDHLLRLINNAVDFSFVYELARPHYSHTGQPSVDPVVLFKMALLQYLYDIPSERRLAQEIPLNLGWLWFLHYNLEELTPNHSVLSKARNRFGKELYHEFFRRIVALCQGAGLIRGDKVVVDATLVKANASLDSLVSRSLYQQLPGSPEEFVDRLWQENAEGEAAAENTGDNAEGETGDRGGREESKPERAEKLPKSKVNEERVSRTDPDAALVRDSRGALQLAHKVHLGVDGGEARVITSVAATSGDVCEAHELPHLVEEHRRNTGCKPEEVVADGIYGTEANYGYLMRAGILPSIPRHEAWSKRDVPNRQFVHDKERGGLICPEGQLLKRDALVWGGRYIRYRGSRRVCGKCQRKGECTKAARRSVYRRASEDVLAWAKEHLETARAKKSIQQRKAWVETANSETKVQHGLRRARYRGRWRVEIQAYLAATVYNLKKLVRYGGKKVKEQAIAMNILARELDILLLFLTRVSRRLCSPGLFSAYP